MSAQAFRKCVVYVVSAQTKLHLPEDLRDMAIWR